MVKVEQSMEEVHSILFNDEAEQLDSMEQVNGVSPPKTEPRLLKQKGLSVELDQLAKIPYFNNPKLQVGLMLGVVVVILWGLNFIFSGGESPDPQVQAANSPKDEQIRVLRKSLAQERKRNQNLEIANGLRKQKLEVIPVPPKPSEVPKPKTSPQSTSQATPQSVPSSRMARSQSSPAPRRVVTPSPPRTVTRIVAYTPSGRAISQSKTYRSVPQAKPKPVTSVQASTKKDPMERWLAAANQGHYITSAGDEALGNTSDGAMAQPAVYSTTMQSDSDLSPTPGASTPDSPANSANIPTAVPLGSTPDQATASLQSGDYNAESQTTTTPPSDPQLNQSTTSLQTEKPNQAPAPLAPTDPNHLLDIGASAKAVLENGIAWTSDGPDQNLSHLLRLKDGFKNRAGVEVLPEDTYLVAQLTQKTDSGLFFLEVTQILRGPQGEKIPVPPGALQVVADDGSPLKADLKQKGGRSFWDDAAEIIAPGIQQGMGALANSGDSLILEDGNRSLIRSSGDNDNPLAAGISGIAQGVGQRFGNQSNGPSNASAPYFKFDGGKTVRVLVNQDVQL